MTVAKARLYKTARIIDLAWELPTGFVPGEFVGVKFLYQSFGANVFQCTNVSGEVAAISEFELESFVL